MPAQLDEPLTLPCGVRLKNRIAKAAMTEGLADAANRATPALETLYRRWANGGAGLLITGNIQIDRRHLERPGNVVIDGAEDAEARAALDAIANLRDPRLALRINGLMTRAGLADALALANATARPALVFVPMVESPVELAQLRAVLADDAVRLVPLIETVAGLRAADAIAADPSTAMLMFGGGDFSAQLGVPLAWEPLALARAQLVMASSLPGPHR